MIESTSGDTRVEVPPPWRGQRRCSPKRRQDPKMFGAIATLGDLKKAYEQVCPVRAWESAKRTGFPLRLVAWLTSLYTGPRWLVFANTIANAPL